MKRREALVGIGSMAITACGGSGLSPTAQEPEQQPVPEPFHTLVGAGDIGWRGLPGAGITAGLLDGISGSIFTTGDNIYLDKTGGSYEACFAPYWGRHRGRIRPALGNHDYDFRDGRAYFDYFGAAAGEDSLGYYHYMLGNWLVLVLDSCSPCDRKSAQYRWAEAKLKSTPVRGIVAYWHHPLASSGRNGPNPYMADIWELLQRHRADIVVAGHDHLYERSAPMNNAGKPDAGGPRQFTVGTGGALHYEVKRVHDASEKLIVNEFGVLKLELGTDSYRWKFIVSGGTILDSGEQVLA